MAAVCGPEGRGATDAASCSLVGGSCTASALLRLLHQPDLNSSQGFKNKCQWILFL